MPNPKKNKALEKNKFFTVDQFSQVVKVHKNTVYAAIRCGRIQAFRVGRGKKAAFRIPENEIERMLAFDATEVINKILEQKAKE